MKALLIIAWVGGQAQIPMPDLLTCQAVGATIVSQEATEILCASTEDLPVDKGIDL